jgi:hypothetical protein
MDQSGDIYSPLWSTRLARVLYVNNILDRFGYAAFSPYAFVFLLLFLDVGVLSTIKYLFADGYHPLLENPFWWAAPIGLGFAIWSSRWLVRGHQSVVETYNIDEQFATPDVTPESFYELSRTRVKYVVFGGLLLFHSINYIVLSGWTDVTRIEGPVIGFLKFGLIIPFGYFPLAAEFAGLVLAVVVIFPRYIVSNEFQLQFDDPLDTGGLEPVGNLIKRAAYIYAFGLILALVFEFGSVLVSEFRNPATTTVQMKTAEFVAAWLLGIGLILYGTFTLHSYMQKQKEQKIRELDRQLRELGSDDRGFPETEPDDTEYARFEYEYLRLQKVKDTSTFPFTPATEERLVVSALLPVALELAISFVV